MSGLALEAAQQLVDPHHTPDAAGVRLPAAPPASGAPLTARLAELWAGETFD